MAEPKNKTVRKEETVNDYEKGIKDTLRYWHQLDEGWNKYRGSQTFFEFAIDFLRKAKEQANAKE